MAEQPDFPAGAAGHQDTTAPEDNSTLHPDTQDIGSIQEDYKPLPLGCWILPFHGNCPRCHHHHRAAEVQVKVTKDPSQVSHVRCERCQQKWAAFGGRNTTRISLLSTTTTEADSMDKDLRYSLVQVVKVAIAKASLGTLPESSPLALSPGPSQEEPTSAHLRASLFSDNPVEQGSSERAEDTNQEQHGSLQRTSASPKEIAKLMRKRDRTIRLFSKLKIKFTAQFSKLRRTQPKSRASCQTAKSAAQREQTPIRTPQTTVRSTSPVGDPPAEAQTHSLLEEDTVDAQDSIRNDADKPAPKFAEVAAFMKTLDKDVLASLNDQERIVWMRRAYSDFKHRNKASLRCSSITEVSTTPSTPSWPMLLNRLSNDVSGVGAHLIEALSAMESRPRRHSIATSDGLSERLSILDGSTVVSIALASTATPTQRSPPEIGSQPPFVDRSSVHSHRRSLRSLEPPLHSRVESLASLRGHAGSRLSQGSMTAYESMTNIPEMLLQSHERRQSSPGPSLPRPMSS